MDDASALFDSLKVRGALAAAAVVALIASLLPPPGPVLAPEPVLASYSSQIGETKRVTLEDGTQAILGAATQIQAAFGPGTRVVRLSGGAAFFEVVADPDRPFSVEAGDLTATAIGTQFDVRSNAGVFRVAVAEGTVRVSYPFTIGGKATSLRSRRNLTAGQEVAATQQQGLRTVEAIDAGKVGAWRQGRLVYLGATVAELVADANRYSAVFTCWDFFARAVSLSASQQSLGQECD